MMQRSKELVLTMTCLAAFALLGACSSPLGSLPPVSAAAEGELDSADPDTIVAADEPPPAVEPSVDDLQLIESETTAPGTPDDVGVREPSDGDLPEWLAGEQGTEDRGETTGGEVDLSMSLESIPESARLSQLDGTAEEDDDLSGDLELELALEVDDDLGTGEHTPSGLSSKTIRRCSVSIGLPSLPSISSWRADRFR